MWQAKFSNGEVLNEFNAEGNEVLFGKVLERISSLESLSIILNDRIFTVRLSDGRFNINDNHFFISGIDPALLTNIRPIYFVRETVNFNARLVGGKSEVNFTALGFQANINGRNIKHYLAILPDGSFIIRNE
jgi:hypothetical protein